MMKKLNKDYRLVLLVTLFTAIGALLLQNASVLLNNSMTWQFALIGLSAIVVFTLVNIFMLSQKLREKAA